MILDFHTHVQMPEQQAHPMWHGRCPMTIENVLEAQKEGGVDCTLISQAMHQLRDMDRDQQLDEVKKVNRYIASLQEKHPSIYGMAGTVPHGDDAFLREFERAIKQDGLKGAWILSSQPGHYPDDDECLPFFKLATELDVPVVIHPPSVGFGEERLRDYRLASSVGRPMDNALAIARLIVRGIFEKFPTLQTRRYSFWRRHLRNDRTDGLRLQSPGRGIFPGLIRTDADQASAQPLSEDDVSGVRPATIHRQHDAVLKRLAPTTLFLAPTLHRSKCSKSRASN